jgi:hypothetical protein
VKREHLRHHFYLVEDNVTECGACGAKYRPSDLEVVASSTAGSDRFMREHWDCRQKIALSYRIVPPSEVKASPSEKEVAPSQRELVEHYTHACNGDKTRALLMALDAGFDFDRVVCAFEGNEGLRISFECILKGWVSEGQITAAGRAKLHEAEA